MSTEIIKTEVVKIGNDEVDAIRDKSGDGWVVVRRVCEVLGIASNNQVIKLKKAPWAVSMQIISTGPDGKEYEHFCLSVDSTPMWLATIQSARVNPKIKPKLIQFQKLAAKALADWAYGKNAKGSNFNVDQLNATLEKMITAMTTLTTHVMTLTMDGTLRSLPSRELDDDDVDPIRVPPRKLRKMLSKIISRSTDHGHGYEFRYGWDQLYRMYGRDSGIDLHQMAIQLSQTTGKEVKPLDLAEKWGHLVPLYRFALVHMKTGAPRVLPNPAPKTTPTKDTSPISVEDLQRITDFDTFYE